MANITITKQPANVSVVFDEIAGSVSVVADAGEEVISYQWYQASLEDLSDGVALVDETDAELTIPTDLSVGTVYLYCVMTANTYDETTTDAAAIVVSENEITITAVPEDTVVAYDDITETLSIEADAGTQEITYAWYIGTEEDLSDAEEIEGATTEELTIPTDLLSDEYYVYATLSATGYAEATIPAIKLTVAGSLPLLADPITGAYVHTYLDNCDASVRERFDALCALTGIEIPDTNAALRSVQIELFMSSL